jgi:hypothetical protein
MRPIWRAVSVTVAVALVLLAQDASADCSECESWRGYCYSEAVWYYMDCEGSCYDWSCSVDCRATYLMALDYCDWQYDWCSENCTNSTSTGCGGYSSTCACECPDTSWSGIACNEGQIAYCTCSGSPVQANPRCE